MAFKVKNGRISELERTGAAPEDIEQIRNTPASMFCKFSIREHYRLGKNLNPLEDVTTQKSKKRTRVISEEGG
jgi:hypothetical protein